MEEIKNENIDMCRQCGGICCLKSGCDYSADDFKDCSYEGLLNELSKGDKSIVCFFDFKTDSYGKYFYEPFLYIRARNTNRDIIDLISMKTKCSLLGDNGCKHDYVNRPEGGRNLTPRKDKDSPCIPIKNPLDIVMSWKPYQKVLKRIIVEYTKMDLKKKISQDVENLFLDILKENYQDVSIIEKHDLKKFVVLLAQTFPRELHNANVRYEKEKPIILLRK